MEQWLIDLMALCPCENWESKRRWLILARWPDSAVRAAEQDARMGKTDTLAQYDSEVIAIKLSVPKT